MPHPPCSLGRSQSFNSSINAKIVSPGRNTHPSYLRRPLKPRGHVVRRPMEAEASRQLQSQLQLALSDAGARLLVRPFPRAPLLSSHSSR